MGFVPVLRSTTSRSVKKLTSTTIFIVAICLFMSSSPAKAYSILQKKSPGAASATAAAAAVAAEVAPVTVAPSAEAAAASSQQQQQQQRVPPVFQSDRNLVLTWEADFCETICETMSSRHSDKPYIIGVVGIPGSGKSTSAEILANLIEQSGISTCVLPMDGYHYSVAQLQAMANPDDVIYRRGAPDTFDAAGLVRDLGRIGGNSKNALLFPGFDHARGDPEPNQHVYRDQSVVIVEGLYLLHDTDGWESLKELLDVSVFVDANVDLCMERLKIRNLSIPGYTREEILVRVDAVDRVNANTVARSKQYADVVVASATAAAASTAVP